MTITEAIVESGNNYLNPELFEGLLEHIGWTFHRVKLPTSVSTTSYYCLTSGKDKEAFAMFSNLVDLLDYLMKCCISESPWRNLTWKK